MAQWHEVKCKISEKYSIDEGDSSEFSLNLHIDHDAGLRTQRVFVRYYSRWQRDFVEIRSAFGLASEFSSVKLLSDNLSLPIGAFALHEGFCVLLHRCNLTEVSADWIVFLAEQIGILADRIEASSGTDSF